MDISNPPNAIHSKAIDLAREGDRGWFEQNPDRLHRLRDMIPFENNSPIGLLPYGMTWRIIVTQINSGMRFRLPVPLPKDLPNEGFDDKRIAEIFEKVAPPEAKKMLMAAMRDRKKK
jgi:hypothetical protein